MPSLFLSKELEVEDFSRSLGRYLGILVASGMLGVAIGSLFLIVFGIEYDNNDSYRLVYATFAFILTPIITNALRNQ
jgi:hypothetical protein